MKNLPEEREAPPPQRGKWRRQLIRRTREVTSREFPAEEKIRVVLDGISGEVAVSKLCRRESVHPTICETVPRINLRP